MTGLIIRRIPKTCAILQLVSAPLNTKFHLFCINKKSYSGWGGGGGMLLACTAAALLVFFSPGNREKEVISLISTRPIPPLLQPARTSHVCSWSTRASAVRVRMF